MRSPIICALFLSLILFGCGETAVPTTLNGQVKELGSEGLEGVTFCLAGSDVLCAQSDSEGLYRLEGPAADADLSFTVTKDGYLGGALSITTSIEPFEVPVVSMAGEVVMELQMGILSVDAIEETGQIAFSISNGINGDGVNVPNIQTTLEPASGDGPFYSNDSGLPAPELTQTSANGGGVYVNVEPGIYSLTHLDIPNDCSLMLGWGSAGSPSFEVFANRVTYVRIECLDED